jgi:hypothetical protein
VVKTTIRDDLSDKLIHPAKGQPQSAASTLLSIIAKERLIGGTGNIKARVPCVCFGEAPISKLAQILARPLFSRNQIRAVWDHGRKELALSSAVDPSSLISESLRPPTLERVSDPNQSHPEESAKPAKAVVRAQMARLSRMRRAMALELLALAWRPLWSILPLADVALLCYRVTVKDAMQTSIWTVHFGLRKLSH